MLYKEHNIKSKLFLPISDHIFSSFNPNKHILRHTSAV